MYISVIKANVFWCQRLHLVSSIHFLKLAADYIAAPLTNVIII